MDGGNSWNIGVFNPNVNEIHFDDLLSYLGLVVGQTILNLTKPSRENLNQNSSGSITRSNINYHGFIIVLNQALRKCALN